MKILEKIIIVAGLILLIFAILFGLLAMIFMIIRATTGHCTPWMLKMIEIEKQALRRWANS